jgi:TPR repeat protein
VCSATTITFALGWRLAPWLHSDAAPWMQHNLQAPAKLPTVLASNAVPKSDVANTARMLDPVSFDQLRLMAEKGDAAAQNALALRYAIGDGVKLSEFEAVRWFTKAAEQGNVSAQSKLGSLYYSGRGVPQDLNRAYFWMVVAGNGGDEASRALAPFVQARLSRGQAASIEREAGLWIDQHRPSAKPTAGKFKGSNTPTLASLPR